jgi:hypothetical protein
VRADRKAPVLGAGEVETAADPDTVWVVLADIQGWPSWNPDITDAMLRGPLQPGTTFSWKSGPGTITSTFLVVEQPTELTWTGKTIVSTEESWGGLQVAPGMWGCTGSYRNAGGEGTLVEFGNGRGQMTLQVLSCRRRASQGPQAAR